METWHAAAAVTAACAAALAWARARRLTGLRALRHPTPPPLVAVENRILPMLKLPGFLAPYRDVPPPLSFATTGAVGNLITVYVIDVRGDLTFVSRGMLEAWGIDVAALHRIATRNLAARSERLRGLLEPVADAPAVLEALDGYDAARLLVASAYLTGPPARYLLAVPDEHVLLVFQRPPSSGIAGIATVVRRRHLAASLPLSPALFALTEAGPAALDATSEPQAS
ncbi:MAG: hypothetical protein HY660_14775 [Armatimonadetes bacterium]|nr:hypothetical protein [Armatimonadota bacterium]